MAITSDQSRAARGLLNWTQDELAINSRVSRATVADFESNARRPMKNNVLAMEDSMFAAGVEFIPEKGTEGAGVRFRERKLQYSRNVRVDTLDGRALIAMVYADKDFSCVIPREVIEDHFRMSGGELKTADDYRKAISEILHHILAAVERQLKLGSNIDGGQFIIRADMLDPVLR